MQTKGSYRTGESDGVALSRISQQHNRAVVRDTAETVQRGPSRVVRGVEKGTRLGT
jgi:hypothetical protein